MRSVHSGSVWARGGGFVARDEGGGQLETEMEVS